MTFFELNHSTQRNVYKKYCKEILIVKIKISKQVHDRGPFDQKSVDRNCVFSVDRNFHNQLTEIFDIFQLIE